MSNTAAERAAKAELLESLRFRKKAKANATLSHKPTPSSSSSSSLNGVDGQRQARYGPQPTQSRDATVPSRFFRPNSPPMGTVLVPDSSPEQPPRQQGHPSPPPGPASSAHANIHGSAWAPRRNMLGQDPLTGSSSFTVGSPSSNPSLRRQRPVDQTTSVADEPPRKKQNVAQRSPDPLIIIDISDTPSSPEIQRSRVARRPRASSDVSMSDDDSLPDVSALLTGSNSKSRLTRERPTPVTSQASPPPPPSVSATPSVDPGYAIFRMSYPTDSDTKVRAAWTCAAGDKARAAAFLANPSWIPPLPKPQVKVKVTPDTNVGRVKEIDEANNQQRAALREKGRKSMIYANRAALETPRTPSVTSVPASEPVVASPTSPSTPFIAAPRKTKRIKKMVLSSDEEEDSDDGNVPEPPVKKARVLNTNEGRALAYFNNRDAASLQELTGCTTEQAQVIISKRPFESEEDFAEKLGQGKKKAGPAGLSPRIFDDVVRIFEGYGSVDSILDDCERTGEDLRAAIASWSISDTKSSASSSKATLPADEAEDGALSLRSMDKVGNKNSRDFLSKQPGLLPKSIQLKDYQLLGVNWLNLMHGKGLSCILADEMGLGKTIQVISFLAHLKENGCRGPHLVIVPSSTLENWCREFQRFAPGIRVQTYYANVKDRPELRATLMATMASNGRGKSNDGWEVLITTYALAQNNDPHDKKFFKRIDWNCTVYDEGHVLKNFQSQRYQALLRYETQWRLLLTGTPLQNNLQELVSLMNFILPSQFQDQFSSLQAIFKAKGNANVSLLSQERISRAKKMMTPFVLRRRKDQVLKDLPKKTERIEWCEMTNVQQTIYNDALQRSRKTIVEAALDTPDTGTPASASSSKPLATSAKKKGAAKSRDKQYAENSSNVLMDLRKAASHPMLFRKLYTDEDLNAICKTLIKEPDFKKRGALFELVKEDMEVMTDAEIQLFLRTYKATRKYLKGDEIYLDAGKITVLLKLIKQYRQEGRKMLVFSQFTQILDIVQTILKQKNIKFLVLTGSTPVDVRQTLVDEFTEDDEIPVFLLSTKAGGMGINLTAASVVVMFDQDFNPHNDKQAHDRAYRIGQKRDVDVVKLISRGTIEEDILKLGETKLALDSAVAGADTDDAEGGDGGRNKEESAPEKEMKQSLMKVLRRQLEKEEEEHKDGSVGVKPISASG